MKICLNFEQDF
ncbi:hypothetical protein D043_1974A, partial [Vibrio parahaemolyticus EKP-021]